MIMATETKTKKQRSFSFKKRNPEQPEENSAKTAEAESGERKYPPNPDTEKFRNAINDAGRAAAYAAEAVVPNTARNRQALVRKTRQDMTRDAVADIIGSGKYKLPNRPQNHTEHAQRKDAAELS
jgi:hypothetical protein